MVDELLLLSGNDIPFVEAEITIHQPRLKEIAYITESSFWNGCEILKFNKENLPDKDKVNLSDISNFNIIMMIIKDKNKEAYEARTSVFSLLALLFPTRTIKLEKNCIQLEDVETGKVSVITQDNFNSLKQILIDMFCLSGDSKEYDPSGELAKKIANQLRRGREKAAKLAPTSQKITLLSRYISILAVGAKKNINDLMDYTVYQLMDEFNRLQLKMKHDIYIQFKCAGATNMQEPEDWFKDIHTNENIVT